jgi:outer membrane protein TolC
MIWQKGETDLARIWLIPALTALLLAVSAGPARAQAGNLKAVLESFGFTLKEEHGRQYVEVTLPQILQLALERNIGLQSTRMGENIALSRLAAARYRFNPSLTNQMDYGRSMSPSQFSNTPDRFVSLSGADRITLSSDLRKPTESGISYGLTYTEQRSRSLSTSIPQEGDPPTDLATGDWLESSALTGSVNVPIGQDFGADLNNIPVRRGELGVASSRLTILDQELQLLELSAGAYWDLVGALEEVRVQEEAVKLSEQLLEDNRARLEAGVLSPFDVQVTETQLARERESLLTARSAVARIEDLVRALLNLEIIDFEIRPQDAPSPRKPDLNYEQALKKVYANNPGVGQLESSLAQNQLDLEEALNLDRTNLDLELFYTMQGYGKDAFGGVSGFDKTQVDGYGATLTWTVPLFDVATQETINQRRLERSQLELQLANLKSDLNVRLQSALRQMRLSLEAVDTAQVARRLAEEQLRNEIERFRVGESTSFQVSQVQQDASAARVREILALTNFERNYLSLLVLTGDIHTHYGIQSRGN